MHEKLYLLERYFEYNENSGLGLFVFTIFIFKFRLCLAGESYLGFYRCFLTMSCVLLVNSTFSIQGFFLLTQVFVFCWWLPSFYLLLFFLLTIFFQLFLFCWWIPSFYILRATNCWKMSRMFGSRSWVKRRVSRVVLYFSTCSWCWNYPNKKSIKQEIITRLVKISFKDCARFWSNLRGDPNHRLAWYSNFPKLSNHPMVHKAASFFFFFFFF